METANNTGFLSILKSIAKRFLKDEAVGLAAQLAYFFLLSLFPFMIFLMTLIGYLPISADLILDFIREFAPGETHKLIQENIEGVLSSQNGKLLSVGLIGTVWSASNAINALIRALNRSYHVGESRNFFISRGLAILLTFGMIVVIIVALTLPVFGEKIGLMVFAYFGLSDSFLRAWEIVRWALSFFVLFIVFASLYFFAPNKHLPWKSVIPGAIVATAGWLLSSLLFSYYVSSFGNFSASYGSLGGIIVLMIWFYLSGMVIILGGEVNAVLTNRKEGIID